MPHFLDETGNIPKEMPKEAREFASFMALIVDETTKQFPSFSTQTPIRCFKKKCVGLIDSDLVLSTLEIHWKCSKCNNEGVISHWQNTKWDNKRV